MATLLILYTLLLAAATIIEKYHGTQVAREVIYTAVWFFALQGLLAMSFIAKSIKMRMWQGRKWGLLVLHYGFVVILLGALHSNLFSVDGIVHIREGSSQTFVVDNNIEVIAELPFEVHLKEFTIERYGGSTAASNYISDLQIEGQDFMVEMNNPLVYKGWKFFQSSYDSDEAGTVLSAAYDGVGTTVSYIGYFMLLVGFVLLLVGRNSRFRRVASTLSVLMALTLSTTAHANTPEEQMIKKFESLVVESTTGRMQSVGSYADDIIRKIAKDDEHKGLNSSQILLGILTDPYKWSTEAIIADTMDEKISFIQLINPQGEYVLADRVYAIEQMPTSSRNKAEKEVLKFNERVSILDNLLTGRLFDIFPRGGTPYWYSPGDKELIAHDFAGARQDSLLVGTIWDWFAEEYRSKNYGEAEKVLDMIKIYQNAKNDEAKAMSPKITAELFLLKYNPLRLSGYIMMTFGLLLIGAFIATALNAGRWVRVARGSLTVLSIVVWLGVTASLILRWYISGRAPLSSSYETFVFVGWATMVVGLFFIRRSAIAFALSVFLTGVLLFVSNLSWMDPQITPLVPVLNSSWLISHVSIITTSYSFFAVCFLLGIATLIMMATAPRKMEAKIAELTAINYLSSVIGLMFLTIGVFIGAVWANESWGRYWGWDPKETWALITMLVYTLLTHGHLIFRPTSLNKQLSVSQSKYPYFYAVGSVVALGSVLMTFFGVNYFLSGMHSYGSISAPTTLWVIFGIYAAVIVLAPLAYFPYSRKLRNKS